MPVDVLTINPACVHSRGLDAPPGGGDRQLLCGDGFAQRSLLRVPGELHRHNRDRTFQRRIRSGRHGNTP